MTGSSNNSFPPSNCQTISEFKITGGYSIDNKTTRSSIPSISTQGAKNNNSNNGEVEICMKYDKQFLDAEIKLGFSADESINKELMKEFISAITYEESEFYKNSYNRAPCGVKVTNTNNWIWNKAITIDTNNSEIRDNDKYNYPIGIPPRTQSLCLGYLDKLNVNIIKDVYGISRLLYELIIAAKLEGQKLEYQYKNNGDRKKLCKALGYSYADYGDLIKGTSIWGNTNTKQLEKNLKHIFQTVFKNKIEQNGKSSDQDKYPRDLKLLREAWWNTNKQYILGALIFGAQTSIGKNDSSCVEQMKKFPPTTDYIPQFLRFTQEWVEHFCNQRVGYAKEVIEKCKTCLNESKIYHMTSNVDDNTANSKKCWLSDGTTQDSKKCQECKFSCDKYRTFVEENADKDNEGKTWRERWKQMDRIYGNLIKIAKKEIDVYKEKRRKESQRQQKQVLHIPSSGSNQPYMTKCSKSSSDDNECLKPDNDSFYQYLAYNGYTTLSSYMNFVLKYMDCGDDKPKWDPSTVVKETHSSQPSSGSGKTVTKAIYPQVLGSIPAGYKYACQCLIPSREELCRDNHMYNTRWVCVQESGTSSSVAETPPRKRRSAPSGKPTYELCRLRHDETDEQDKTFTSATKSTRIGAQNLSDEDMEFFNSFDSWYKDIQDKLDRHFHRISRDCKLENIMAQSGDATAASTPTISPECQNCRDNCECYKLWVKHMKDQWDKQKTNYEKFQKKELGQAISLNDYLFTRCWGEYFEKDVKSKTLMEIDPVDDIHIINLLQERCGKDKGNAEKKFKERIKKAENERRKCDIKQNRCQKGRKTFECDKKIDGSNVSACGQKEYDDRGVKKKGEWKCTQNGKEKLEKDVCVPPRTQSLCVANMYGSDGKRNKLLITYYDKDKWKTEIRKAMKKETENLYDYYKSTENGKGAIISKNPNGQLDEKDSNGMPKNFCKAAERTYNDFKNLVTGDMLWKPESIGAIDTKIDEIIKNGSKSDTVAAKEDRQKWWDTYSDKFWDAVKCGIKAKHGGGSATGDECGEFPPDDTNNQFVWWFKEWGQQFCIERQNHIDAINENCESSENNRCHNKSTKTLEEECKKRCDAYKTFIEGKKEAWNKQKTKYERENPENFAHELFAQHYLECLGSNFEQIFEEKDTHNSKKSTVELKYEYGDASDICSCEQQTYKSDGKHPSSCRPKSGDLTTWSTHLLKKGKDGKQLQGVYAPPRRKKLCLANLYPINFGNNKKHDHKKNTLLNRLQIVAEREAYYLWKYYHEKNKINDEKSHQKTCCAIRSSFFDIGDIVKGTDLWDDPSKKYIDKTLNDIFGKELEEKENEKKQTEENTKDKAYKQMYAYKIKEQRKKWWDEKRNSIWDAMQFGTQNAMKELGANVENYNEIECLKDNDDGRNVYQVAIPQFVRWLEEWVQQFCEEYKIYFGEVEAYCKTSNGSNDCNYNNSGDNSCKIACTKYNDWISLKKKEWVGMSRYYENVKGKDENISPDFVDYGAVHQPTAIDYLNQECKNEINGTNNCCHCENVGTSTSSNSLEHMDKVVNKTDDKYKKYMPQCTKCYIQHIKDQINTIEQKIRGRQDQNAKGKSSSSSNNPCAQTNNKPAKNVTKIAEERQKAAEETMKKNCVVNRENKLKGDISQAQFKNNLNGNTLNDSEICNLDKNKHTNDHRPEGEPCKGKGGDQRPSINTRFVVGVRWEADKSNMHKNHQDVIMPPRRRHICTSNLENLDVDKAEGLTNKNKVNDSFLGDVLLSAKEEAQKIIDMYKEKNGVKNLNDQKHKESVCRAMKYSFADIGDIIRGRDLWSRNTDMQHLEEKLVAVFKKIKENTGLQNIYTDNNGGKYTEMRKDWWALNREQIWQAMLCATTSSGITCNGSGPTSTPLDDYVPQRLRWMTEWIEWFCKAQKEEYDNLMGACATCMSGGTTCGSKCTECRAKCNAYSKFIEDWEKDWDKQKNKYEKLYEEATTKNPSSSNDENQKYLNEFLKQLKDSNNGNTTYSTAEGYVHEELPNLDCQIQEEFCENKNAGGKNDNYAFQEYPKDFKHACGCQEDTAQTTSQQTPTSTPVAPNYSQGSGPGTTPSPAAVVPQAGGSSQDGTQTKGQPQAKSGGAMDNGQVPKPQGPPPQGGNQSHGSGRQVPGGNLPTQDPKQTGSKAGEPHGAPGSQPSAGRADPGKDGQNGQQTNTVPSGSPVAPGGQGNSDPIPGKSTTPADEFKELNTCPFGNGGSGITTVVNNVKCKSMSVNSRCVSKTYDNNLDQWSPDLVKNNNGENEGVLMPPRRVNLCRAPFLGQRYRLSEKGSFINDFYTATFNQGILLGMKFKDYKDEAHDALKNSFYDYANIVKGTDMVEGKVVDDLNKSLNEMFPKNSASSTKYTDGREQWWELNRTRIWNNMLCGYHKGVTDPPKPKRRKNKSASSPQLSTTTNIPLIWCKVPDDDSTPQFLRWMTEWARQFCEEKGIQTISLKKNCLDNDGDTTQYGTNKGYKLTDYNCISSRTIYKEFLRSKNEQWKAWENKYQKYQKEKVVPRKQSSSSSPATSSQNGAEEYVKSKCSQCDCNINNLEDMYKQIEHSSINSIKKIVAKVEEDIPELKFLSLNDNIKSVQDLIEKVTENAQIIEEQINPKESQLKVNKAQSSAYRDFGIVNNFWNAIKGTVLPLASGAGVLGYYGTIQSINKATGTFIDILKEIKNLSLSNSRKISSTSSSSSSSSSNVLGRGQSLQQDPASSHNGGSGVPDGPQEPGQGSIQQRKPQHQGTQPLSSILSDQLLPTTIPFSIGIAFASLSYLLLKKKTILRPTKLLRVIHIPQNDYGIPDETSTNKYVPYGRYKGKTYIYVEGEETHDYVRDISSSDITSSSESEYEEMDINDIYPYKSPKYKTLIEVVLKPSRKTYDDTYTYHENDNNKLTDNEWNELKQDFFFNMLQNDNMVISSENISGNNTNTQPDTVDSSMEEKPFITSIHDRDLHGESDVVSYNIDWNVPKNSHITANTADNPTYVSPNLYSGIDLINDSLNRDQDIDIYDELLKRKENELFGKRQPTKYYTF